LGRRIILPPIIQPKFPSARNCVVPACQSCLIAWARKRLPKVAKTKAIPKREGALSCDKYDVGDFVSTDQFICWTPGRLPEGYGREPADLERYGYRDHLMKVVVMALAGEVARELSPIRSWSNKNYEI